MLSLKYRNVTHFSESYLRSVSSKTTSDFEQSVNTQTQKFTEFEVRFCEVSHLHAQVTLVEIAVKKVHRV